MNESGAGTLNLLTSPNNTGQALFSTQRCARFIANSLAKIVKGICRHAGLDRASSHSGRRTGFIHLIEKGVSIQGMRVWAGYTHMATTQRHID